MSFLPWLNLFFLPAWRFPTSRLTLASSGIFSPRCSSTFAFSSSASSRSTFFSTLCHFQSSSSKPRPLHHFPFAEQRPTNANPLRRSLQMSSREHPFFLLFMQLALMSIFKSYPTVGDASLYLAFLPVWSDLNRCKLAPDDHLLSETQLRNPTSVLFSSRSSFEEHLPGDLHLAGLLRSLPGALAPLDLRRQRQLQLLLCCDTVVHRGAGGFNRPGSKWSEPVAFSALRRLKKSSNQRNPEFWHGCILL